MANASTILLLVLLAALVVVHGIPSDSPISLLDLLDKIDFENDIKISFPDPKEHMEWKLQKEKQPKLAETQAEICADQLNLYTETMLRYYPYKQMSSYSGSDIARLGDKEACDALGVARYYVFAAGLKQLPLELRVGMCMPQECTPDVMANAMSLTSGALNDALSPLLEDPPMPLPTDVVPEFKFTLVSPDHWKEEKEDSRKASSAIVLTFLGGLVFLVAAGTVYENHYHSPTYQGKPKPSDKGKVEFDVSFESSQVTLPSNEFNSSNQLSPSTGGGGRINLSDQVSSATVISSERNFGDQQAFIKNYDNFFKRSGIGSILSCFSLQVNFNSLGASRRHPDEHPELEVMEGVRVITMFWGIFCATSLYVLAGHVNNILYMLELFKSITFTMSASGNLAHNLMFFFVAFFGFYKLNVLFDKRGGLTAGLYAKVIAYRFLKYIPIYYFVFLVGWTLVPYLSTAPTWYLSDSLYANCDKYWWSTMLFVNNYYPWFTEGLNGCFYWPFVIVCDLQLYFFMPLWVLCYRKSKIAFHILMGVMLVGGMVIIFYTFWKHKLSVGVLTLENYYLWSENFNKPWGKLSSIALGCWFGFFYLELLEYRKEKDKKRRPVMHFIYTSKIAFALLAFWTIAALNFTTLVPYEEDKDAYSWTRFQNSIYSALCQFGYLTPMMALFVLLFTGRLNILLNFLGGKFWRPISRVSIIAYLLYPIVIMSRYVGSHESIYLRIMDIVYYTIDNIVITYLASFVIFFIFYGPVTNLIKVVLSKYRNYETPSYLYVKEDQPIEKEVEEQYHKDK